MTSLTPDQVTVDTFSPLVNESFTVEFNGGITVAFTLYQATSLPSHDYPGKSRDPFQLRFSASTSEMLPQGLYPMKNATLGEVALFLVPIQPEDGKYCYQALFN